MLVWIVEKSWISSTVSWHLWQKCSANADELIMHICTGCSPQMSCCWHFLLLSINVIVISLLSLKTDWNDSAKHAIKWKSCKKCKTHLEYEVANLIRQLFKVNTVISANALKTNKLKSNLSYFLPQIYLWHSCCVGFLFPEEKEGQTFGNWGERD